MFYIYRITNLVNGKTYIGQHEYKDLNDDYMGSGALLLKAQKKYGIENFKKEILVFNISRKEHIDLLEKTFIASEREKVGRENCYNIADGGEGGNGGATKGRPAWNKGIPMSEEQKIKCREARLGIHMSEEAKKKISEYNKGKTLSEEHKKKIAETLEGHTVSEETREKLRAHKGWHHTEETRKKMSESRKGVKRGPLSKEHKMKIAEANRNRSEETRKKLSEAVKGKKWFNNGEISVMSFECPKGFVPGRISWKKKGDR